MVWADTTTLRIGGGYCRVHYAPASITIENARLLVLDVTSCIVRIYLVHGQFIRQNTTISMHR